MNEIKHYILILKVGNKIKYIIIECIQQNTKIILMNEWNKTFDISTESVKEDKIHYYWMYTTKHEDNINEWTK